MARSMNVGVLAFLLAAGTAVSVAGAGQAAGAVQVPAAADANMNKIDLAAKLPIDPALVTGKLSNGLAYVIRKHNNPEARVSVWLHVSSGSLNESEETRGIAHFLEHMAFNGSKNFPPGSVVNFFQSLGLQFGRDQNAFTSFDQTTYQLALPDNTISNLDKAMLFMSDVGGRLSLPAAEIESERGIIQEERRTRLSAQQRVQERVLLGLAPESTLGRRLPIGTVETINSVQPKDFEAYYRTFYSTGNMTLIVVGDVEPAKVIERAEAAFADLPKAERPKDLDAGVKGTSGRRAVVATDPELTSASLSINRISPPLPPNRTVGDFRRELVETIGTWAVNRRISAKLAKSEQPYLTANAAVQDLANTVRIAGVSAGGKAENWRAMLTEVCKDLNAALSYGVTQREVDDARNELISSAEQAVVRETTLPARAMLGRINGALAADENPLSASQRLDLLKTLLPTISAAEVGSMFSKVFDFENAVIVLEAPSSGDVPSEEQLVKLASEALATKAERPTEEVKVAALLAKMPTAGTVEGKVLHEPTGVTSWWLSNGVRVHHRSVEKPKGQATISILLPGGELNETAANRGISSVAGLAWADPATKQFNSTQLRDFFTGKNVSVSGNSQGDSYGLSVSGAVQDLDAGMQLAYLLLTEPKIETAAVAQWKQGQEEGIKMRKSRPEGVLVEVMSEAMLPADEVRSKPLTAEQVSAVSIEQSQAWLEGIIAAAPIEVAVVGDIDAATAEKLVTSYLGALSKREKISDQTLAARRILKRNPGPLSETRSMATKTDKAIVLDGFTGPDATDVSDVRLMQLASRVLSTRMVKTIREEKRLVYSISARSQPGVTYKGSGMFLATAPTDPANAAALPAALDEMYVAFAKTGPTTEELDVARNQLVKSIEEAMKEPAFWAGRLSGMTYRGSKLDDVVTLIDFYKAATSEQVRETFNRYYTPANRFQFIVKPE